MKSSEILSKCYEAVRSQSDGKYWKKDFARDIGISQQNLSNIMNDERGIGKTVAEKLSIALSKHGFHVTPGHILDGLTQERWDLTPESEQPVAVPHIHGKHLNGEPVKIPYYRISAAAGGGVFAEGKTEAVQIYFLSGWIRDCLDTSPNNLFAMDVYGDSMEPTLRHGDTILVDKKKNHLRTNGLYVMEIGDMLVVKRVEVQPDNSMVIKSDNPSYESYVIRPGDEGHFEVKGRAVKLIGRDIL